MMETNKIVRAIGAKAHREAAYLAGEFARAASEEKERILAALEYQRWLAECCEIAYDNQTL